MKPKKEKLTTICKKCKSERTYFGEFNEIENYKPCYVGHSITLKSCYKRAKSLSKEDFHSGIICNNQDPAKVVFLCKTLSDLKSKYDESEKLNEELIECLKSHINCEDSRNIGIINTKSKTVIEKINQLRK